LKKALQGAPDASIAAAEPSMKTTKRILRALDEARHSRVNTNDRSGEQIEANCCVWPL